MIKRVDMIDKLKAEVKKVVIGHDSLIDAMLIALFTSGHILIEGISGVAKTTAVNALAKALGFDFKRVQFTPDLLPSDIIGNEILDLKSNEYKIKHGPIFTNLLLADEINRSSPKVQSALLEAMAEGQVTIGEQTFKLNSPFMVLATQNPIDQEGTYELPEASLDRFLIKVDVGYNSFEEELEIMELNSKKAFSEIAQVLNYEDFLKISKEIESVHVDRALKEYMLTLVFKTRQPIESLKKYIDFGVSPRGSIALYKVSKAIAYLLKRDYVRPSDIAKAAFLTMNHRIKLNYQAVIDNINSSYIIKEILQSTPAP